MTMCGPVYAGHERSHRTESGTIPRKAPVVCKLDVLARLPLWQAGLTMTMAPVMASVMY